jgi:division protein CdvB (Snf7/Vps24/ESCRT-III family)
MVRGFANRWKAKEQEETVVSKIKNATKPQVSLKEQITAVTQRLDLQTRTLDAAVQRFQNRDAELFQRVVKAQTDRDPARANIYATELSEVRKVETMLTHASLALQSMSMRLSTVSEMGDIVTVLAPAKNLINGIRTEMCGIMPEASQELGSIGSMLGDICTSTSQGSDMQIDTARASTPEAMEILQEAEMMAARKLEDQFPTVAENNIQKRTTIEESS